MIGESQQPDDIAKTLSAAFEEPAEGAETFTHSVELDESVDLTDNSQEGALMKQSAEEDGVVVPDLPEEEEVEPASLFDDDPVTEAKEALERAFKKDFDFGVLEVDALEKDRFYRCGLHDTEMWYDVEAPGYDLTIRVAIPTVSRSEAALATLDVWRETGVIGNSSVGIIHNFQLINTWLMVRQIGGRTTDWLDAAVEDAGGKLTYRDLRRIMENPDFLEPIREMGEVRWRAVSLAVRIADYKHTLCLEAIRSRKVFTTAGSA